MSSHITLVNVDSAAAAKLSGYISQLIGGAEASSFLGECKVLAEGQQTAGLISKFLEKASVIFGVENDKDVEGIFEAIVSVIFTLKEDVDTDTVPIIREIATSVASDKSTRAKLRLQILVSLFNLTAVGQSKYDVLTEIFKYALATGQADSVAAYHDRIEGWVKNWAITTLQQRELYNLSSDVLAKDGKDSLALKFLILYLGTYGVEAYPPAVQELATSAVLKAVKSPVSSFSDRNALLESFSNRQATGALGKLVELLKIICTGTLESYQSFVQANKTFFSEQGIDQEELEHSIKLLALCSLGAQQQVLSYDLIVSTLKVDVSDVETWIVDAIAQGLLEANIDQLNDSITIIRCVHRSFGAEQWKSLQQKLRALRATVAGVIETSKKYSSA